MIDEINNGLVARKLETFKHMIPHNEQGCHATQSVEQGIMGFRVGNVIFIFLFVLISFFLDYTTAKVQIKNENM